MTHRSFTSPGQDEDITVLHIDDEPDLVDLAATFLEKEDPRLNVIPITSPEEGLERLAETTVDCVVSDYDMPGQSGLDLLRGIRKTDPDLPFILFTGKGSEEIASKAISSGVTDYLQKSGGTEQYTVLANRIENAVAKRRAEQLIDRAFRAMDSSREGIALLNENGEFLYVNDAYAEILGYDEAELIGEFWEMVYPDRQAERIIDDILPRIPEEGCWTGDTVYKRKDGERVLVNHALTYSEEGTMICLIRDLSDAELDEQLRRKQRELFDLFIERAEEYAIVLLDPDGYVTSWNSGAEAMTGHAEVDVLGKHISILFPDDERDSKHLEGLLGQATGEDIVTDQGWRVRADGTQFWADDVITALFTEEGDLRGYALVTRDLTDRRAREQALRRTQEQFDALADLFYVVDTEGHFIRFNERLVEVTGYSADELESIHVLELVPDNDWETFASEHEQLLTTDTIQTTESQLVCKDGSHIPYEFRRRRLQDEDGKVIGFAGIGRDITERKRFEREREEHVTRLNEFASVLSHDLRNPLSVAKGHMPYVVETLPNEKQNHAEAINRSLDRIEEIIEDVLEITRTGAPVTEPEPTDVVELATRMWQDMEKGELNPDISVEDIPEIMADQSLLERLLMNLFRNAVEHGGQEVEVTLGALPNGFYVADDGPGIGEDEREIVFDWHYTTKEGGSGIGLRSVSQIVEGHGWDITVTESTSGGARFDITSVKFADG